jgi:hypothetical protein
MRSLDPFNLPNPPSRTVTLGLTQPLTEMNTTNLSSGGEAMPTRKATSPPSVSRMSTKHGGLAVLKLYGPSGLVTRIVLLHFFLLNLFFKFIKCSIRPLISSLSKRIV